jgi:tRNA threonylcarbamoyladenosine biosynthesis protein TsaB
MSLIIHIETATEVCSVSIAESGRLIAIKETHEGRSHAGVLAVYIQDLLKENKISVNQLEAVAVSMGPGSYTGLRIGVSVAKGICYGAGIPLIGVHTLEAMYVGLNFRLKKGRVKINRDTLFAPMIDARRQEVYTCLYNCNSDLIGETRALVVEKDTFNTLLKDHTIYFFGSGADKFLQIITNKNARFIENFKASSADMIAISYRHFNQQKFADLAYFEPYYLKDFITTVAKKNLFL